MRVTAKRYRISVCRGPDCTLNGAEQVFAQAQRVLREPGLERRCELMRGGCYGLCHLGANVVVRELKPGPVDPLAGEDYQLTYEPGETYYWRMTPEGVTRVLREHALGGEVVEGLVGDPDADGDYRKKG